MMHVWRIVLNKREGCRIKTRLYFSRARHRKQQQQNCFRIGVQISCYPDNVAAHNQPARPHLPPPAPQLALGPAPVDLMWRLSSSDVERAAPEQMLRSRWESHTLRRFPPPMLRAASSGPLQDSCPRGDPQLKQPAPGAASIMQTAYLL